MRISDWSSDVCSSDLAALDNFQIAVHAIGDAANAELLSAIADLGESYKGDRRWRIEHAQIVDPADIAKLDRKSVVWGKGVSVRVDLGGRRIIKKKNKPMSTHQME